MISNKSSLRVVVAFLSASSVALAQTVVGGTSATGPASQGACSATSDSDWLCSNGAFCSWDVAALNFSCVGGSGDVVAQTGPPGLSCVPHVGHFDCTGAAGAELLCELSDSVWVCESAASESGTGSTCVVHGGHTHGDCSSQCNGIDLGFYNMNLHIVALFVVLISSAIGVCLPLASSSFMSKKTFRNIFFAAKHFGTGVIISTAFVHLLYHAFIMFSNACLGELKFEPVAAAITMAGTYTVFSIDFFVMRWLKTRTMNRSAAERVSDADSPTSSQDHGKLTEAFGHSHGPAPDGTTDFASPQAHFDAQILEGGIIFHSIMIGVSLGASGGTQWTTLFIAIVFHQMFEGLALGSRIGLLIWPAGEGWRKWAMASVFTLITPFGVGIGIGVHSGYNPNSGAALLSIGILDSISAGILIYAGLVEMLYHDFMHGELSNPRVGWGRVGAAFFFLLSGSLCMSVLGVWA